METEAGWASYLLEEAEIGGPGREDTDAELFSKLLEAETGLHILSFVYLSDTMLCSRHEHDKLWAWSSLEALGGNYEKAAKLAITAAKLQARWQWETSPMRRRRRRLT